MVGRTSLFVGLAATLLVSTAARADVAESLQSLIDQGSVTVGNATYSNFSLPGGTLGTGDIFVTITGAAGGTSSITFAGNWVNNPSDPLQNGASQIEFDVQFATPISSVGLSFAAAGSSGALASVGETVINNATSDRWTLPGVTTDGAGIFPDVLSTSLPFASPLTSIHVQKSIDIAGIGTASISSVTNSYSVPEPASLSILGLGAVGLLRRRSRPSSQ